MLSTLEWAIEKVVVAFKNGTRFVSNGNILVLLRNIILRLLASLGHINSIEFNYLPKHELATSLTPLYEFITLLFECITPFFEL